MTCNFVKWKGARDMRLVTALLEMKRSSTGQEENVSHV